VAKLLIALGLVLFLLGLLTGLVVPRMRNPRMGVASHLEGVTNGPFLMVVGLAWPRIHLNHALKIAVIALLTYGTYANWLSTQLAAIWGAGRRFAPIAAGDHHATVTRERLIDALLATLSLAMIAGSVLLLIGLLR
jgi:(hydroxyamino)benzene mutase